MKIQIEKHTTREGKDYYRADCRDLPGTPPVGIGETSELAMAHLFYLVLFSTTGGFNNNKWLDFIQEDNFIQVNDKQWKMPYKNDI